MLKYTRRFLNIPNTWKTVHHPIQSNASVPSWQPANANVPLNEHYL